LLWHGYKIGWAAVLMRVTPFRIYASSLFRFFADSEDVAKIKIIFETNKYFVRKVKRAIIDGRMLIKMARNSF